ncbi:methyltransferase [Pseudidiomarina terrestris]|uniref:methyltransferase n=1 Tax=Pseudidiomarina terrestris TaxID=2820060 RepID=UPI002656756C|nr:methyltransferase [Pseudidiomarina sp. 1ASP75-5]MDN7134846.1 methyltransferase [Pseudidiomarina sp. 1ASP75-5]
MKSFHAASAPTLFQTAAGRWQLHRYPARSNETLQAWDAADELLHEAFIEHERQGQMAAQPLLVNDAFGALFMAVAPRTVVTCNDSYVSQLAQRANLELNQLECDLTQLSPLDDLPPSCDLVLMKLPKSQSLLEFQLAQLSGSLKPGTTVLVAAKSKLFTPATRAIFSQFCDDVDISLIQRKCRMLRAKVRAVATPITQFLNTWQQPELNLELTHHAGVFARNQLDIGARLLLEHLPAAGAQQVIDLGCGNGVLGLAYARQSPQSAVTWVDESYLAIASCQRNIALNLGTAERYQAYVDDCLSQQSSNSADLVLCNPPFHQEHAITEHIARQMFKDARRVLRKGGEMRLVANRHLPYYQSLKRLFGQVDCEASNAKFVVYRCQA